MNIPVHFFHLDLFFFKKANYLFLSFEKFNENNLENILTFLKKDKTFFSYHYFYIYINPIDNFYTIHKIIYRKDYNDYTIKEQSLSSMKDLSYLLRCLNIQLQFSFNTVNEAQELFLNNYNDFDINLYDIIDNNLEHSYFKHLLQNDESVFNSISLQPNCVNVKFDITEDSLFEVNQFYNNYTFNILQLLGFCHFYNYKLQLDFNHFEVYKIYIDNIIDNYYALYEYYFNDNSNQLLNISFKELNDEIN